MRRSETISAECRLLDDELDRAFVAGSDVALGSASTLSAEARKHLAGCERCRQLYRWAGEALPSLEPSAAVYENVRKRLTSSLRPARPQPAAPVLATRFLLVFFLFTLPLIAMLGPAGLHVMGTLQFAVVVSVLVLGAAVLSLSLGWQMTPGSRQRVLPPVAIAGLIAAFDVGIAVFFPWHTSGAFFADGVGCLTRGLLIAVPAAFLFWLLMRRGFLSGIVRAGATLGAVAGLTGTFVLQLTCNRQEAGHLLVWHAGVLIVATAAGVLGAVLVQTVAARRA